MFGVLRWIWKFRGNTAVNMALLAPCCLPCVRRRVWASGLCAECLNGSVGVYCLPNQDTARTHARGLPWVVRRTETWRWACRSLCSVLAPYCIGIRMTLNTTVNAACLPQYILDNSHFRSHFPSSSWFFFTFGRFWVTILGHFVYSS